MAYLKEEVKAGIIVVSSFVILSAFVILIGGARLFEKNDIYYVKVKNSAGLEEGSQVRLGGVRIGSIIGIKEPSAPGESITLKLGVKKGTPLYKGTRAVISQIGMVGDIYLFLSVKNTTEGRILPGEVIPSDEQIEFNALMAKLDEVSVSVHALIKDVDKIFSQKNIENVESLIRNTNKAIVSGSSNINQIALGLKNTNDKLGRVLVEFESLVKDNKGEVGRLIKRAREDMDKAGEMIRTMEEAAKSVSTTTGTVNRTIDLQSQNIDMLLRSLTRTTEDLHDAMIELKNKPWSVIYKEGAPREE
ncbi:MAG TPA: MlaD family protein [Dissulfurispiraceae bacterium]